MTSAYFARFLSEALATGRESDDGLGKDELYGLYTRWCLTTRTGHSSPRPSGRD